MCCRHVLVKFVYRYLSQIQIHIVLCSSPPSEERELSLMTILTDAHLCSLDAYVQSLGWPNGLTIFRAIVIFHGHRPHLLVWDMFHRLGQVTFFLFFFIIKNISYYTKVNKRSKICFALLI